MKYNKIFSIVKRDIKQAGEEKITSLKYIEKKGMDKKEGVEFLKKFGNKALTNEQWNAMLNRSDYDSN